MRNNAAASPLTVLFEHSVPKHAEDVNEDRWHRSDNGLVIALSDGATISFDAARWADILVRAFVAEPGLSASWMDEARAEFAAAYDRDELPWNMQAALDRGSSATLLGLSVTTCGSSASITAVGDTLAIVAHEGNWLTSYPYENAADFERTPTLLSSSAGEGLDLTSHVPVPQPLPLGEHPGALHILLMTDALGAWCLSRREDSIERLLSLREPDEFEELVSAERAAGALKRDDTTLIVLGRVPT